MFAFVSVRLSAQEQPHRFEIPKVEVFGGFSYRRNNPESGNPQLNLNGWNAAVARNWNPWLSGVAEFSGQCGSQTTPALQSLPFRFERGTTSFLFGPRFSHRRGPYTLFVHALFGAERSNIKLTSPVVVRTGRTGAAMDVGVGLDVRVNRALAIRIFQADYLVARHGIWEHNFRYSGGAVFRLGTRYQSPLAPSPRRTVDAPYLAVIGAHAASWIVDAETTVARCQRTLPGACGESNALVGDNPSRARLYTVGATAWVGTSLFTWYLKRKLQRHNVKSPFWAIPHLFLTGLHIEGSISNSRACRRPGEPGCR
jgi:hypothetical protein